MKQFLKSLPLTIIAIIILGIYLIYVRECKRDEICPPDGYVLVTDGFIDTLQMIAEMPPDTITDTLFLKGDIIYLPGKEVPIPIPVDPQTNFYTDSIVNDSISVWVAITVQGIITEWDWRYQPIIHKIETIIEKPVPYPMPYEVPVSKSGLYAAIGVGGNKSAFMLTGELDLITKKDNFYGFQYLLIDQRESFYLFKIGTKIKLRR